MANLVPSLGSKQSGLWREQVMGQIVSFLFNIKVLVEITLRDYSNYIVTF